MKNADCDLVCMATINSLKDAVVLKGCDIFDLPHPERLWCAVLTVSEQIRKFVFPIFKF